jgi:hypothetical protein
LSAWTLRSESYQAGQLPSGNDSTPTVKDKGQLQVADLRFDNYLGIVSAKLEVRAGDEAGMKFFVEGYSREELKDSAGRPEYRVHLKYSIRITDPEGKSLQPDKLGEVNTVLSMQDDGWRPNVDWTVKMPTTAPPGRYPIHIEVTDEIGRQRVEYAADLRVNGPSIKTSGKLDILNIEFAPSDRGPWRPIWYFELRSPVYVRYKVAGYSVSSDKRVIVQQDWTVLNADGEEVLSKIPALVEDSQAYYPPKFIQGYFSLSLRDPEPGDYKIRIEARDEIGGSAASAEARFVLRR